MKLSILLLSFLIFSTSLARTTIQSSQELSFLIFNIQKTNNWNWNQDLFHELVIDSDIALIQEALVDLSGYPTAFEYEFYQSWGDTGLATISRIAAMSTKKMVSPSAEPILGTPKVSSIELYSLGPKLNNLMVINTHGLNFKSLSSFKDQMDEIYAEVSNHKGPMIWAGDFNTWSSGRWNYLIMLASQLNLSEVDFENRNELFLRLDHAFIRGMDVVLAEQLSIDISDHRPLKLVVSIHQD